MTARATCLRAILLGVLVTAGACRDETMAPDPEPEPDFGGLGPDRILVLNSLSQTISSLDLSDDSMTVHARTVGSWANRLLLVPSRREILVVCSGENEIQRYGREALAPRGNIDLGSGRNPWGMGLGASNRCWVSEWLTGSVAEIDLASGVMLRRIETEARTPEGLTVTEDLVVVACSNFRANDPDPFGEGWVETFDVASGTRVRRIACGVNPQEVVQDEEGYFHVVCTGTYGQGSVPASGEIHVLDSTGSPVDTVFVGGSPVGLALTHQGVAWVASESGGVQRYDLTSRELLAPPAAPELAAGGMSVVAWDSAGSSLYFANFGEDLLLRVDDSTGDIQNAWIVGDGPVDVLVLRQE